MTRSSFNRMIVSSAASIWGDVSHRVHSLRIGTATAALSPPAPLTLHMSDRTGKSRPPVCTSLT